MVFLLYAMLTVDHSVTTRVMDSHMSRWTQLINYHSVPLSRWSHRSIYYLLLRWYCGNTRPRETGALDYSLLTSRHPRMHSSTTPYSPVLTLTAAAIIIMCLLMGSPPRRHTDYSCKVHETKRCDNGNAKI